LYTAHQGGKAVRAVFNAPAVTYDRDSKPATFGGLQGSASLHHKKLVLTAVNPDVSQTRETEITFNGAQPKSATMTVLTASDLHAHNTFAQPDTVVPRAGEAKTGASSVVVTIPAASVVSLRVELG
jgi:alpha-N-arabinofuranosidase